MTSYPSYFQFIMNLLGADHWQNILSFLTYEDAEKLETLSEDLEDHVRKHMFLVYWENEWEYMPMERIMTKSVAKQRFAELKKDPKVFYVKVTNYYIYRKWENCDPTFELTWKRAGYKGYR